MSKKKSVGVTCIVCALLGIATFAAYRLAMPAFIIIVSVFSGIWFLSAASSFCTWLEQESAREEEAVEPINVKAPEIDLGPDFAATYDDIKKELDMVYAKATLDRELQQYVGGLFLPYEERYK